VALGALAAFVLALAGSLVLHRGSALHDTDSYYHLAVARTYAQEGIVHELPQVRRSLMREGFGDKELLFHLLLAPLAGNLDPLAAGRLGLALAGALAAAAVAAFAVRALGWWGVAVPFWLFYASTELAWRLVRLRPELLSLVLLLAAVAAIGRGRDRWLGPVAFLYTWSYTAFQAFLGLAVLSFGYFSWTERRLRWPLLLYPLAGVALALVVHPHFPKNLEIWAVQNLEFFLRKGELDVGTEIRPNFTDVVLMVNLGWFLALAVLGMSARRDEELEPGTDGPLAEALGLATLSFGVLYLLMSRFSLYFIPFATLWWIYELRRRGRRPGAWTALPVRGRVPLALAAAVCLAASFPEAGRQLEQYRTRTALGPDAARIRDREALADAIPAGARVAADWGPTATLMLWAPHGRYLNVLDPVFMATPYPEFHRRLLEVLGGREPDVPAATASALDSDYLLYRSIGGKALDLRLAGDPRVEVLHRGAHTLVRFVAAASFVLDWRIAPEGVRPFAADARPDEWPVYSPRPGARGRQLEAYVDAEREAPDAGCLGFVRELVTPEAARLDVDLAPYGPSSVWLDGRLVVEVRDDLGALLQRGVRLPLELGPGLHRLAVFTCEGAAADEKGFFWRERRTR
jgi:hypothetical protein